MQAPIHSGPFSQVPLEVWGLTFLFIPTEHSWPPEQSYQADLVVVTSVCRAWRDAALATPALWSNLDVDLWRRPASFDALSLWVKRAGSVPKTMNIRVWMCGETVHDRMHATRYKTETCRANTHQQLNPDESSACKLADPAIGRIFRESGGSWKHVEVACPTPECFQHFSTMMQAAFARGDGQLREESAWNSLRSFKLYGRDWDRWFNDAIPLPPNYTSFFDFLPASGSMKAFDLHLPSKLLTDVTDPKIAPSLCQGLVSLSVSSPYAGPLVFAILEQATNLEELTVDFKNSYMNDETTRSTIVLPNLRTVRLLGVVAVSGLETLRFPDMDSLTMKFGDVGGQKWSVDGHVLAVFASGGRYVMPTDSDQATKELDVSSTLRYFEIEGAIFDEDDGWQDHGGTELGGGLVRVLHAIPSVKELCLAGVDFTRDLFKEMSGLPEPCLPALEELSLFDLDEGDFERLKGLREFVNARGVKLTTTFREPDEEEDGDSDY
ncbi:hypothetical protein NMY22_g2044 [Coprinellus aureogranulatus]|nr:hypothetical protein NMY22_g2044 [Coprinellus aureogranulatus]